MTAFAQRMRPRLRRLAHSARRADRHRIGAPPASFSSLFATPPFLSFASFSFFLSAAAAAAPCAAAATDATAAPLARHTPSSMGFARLSLRGMPRWVASNWRRLLWLSVVGWQLCFICAPHLPETLKPDIDTTALPRSEHVLLLGAGFLHRTLEPAGNIVLDCACAVAYTVHALIPFAMVAYLFFRERPKIVRFLFVFGLMNTFGVMIQLLYPTSPPWYYERFGTAPASYAMKGDPARLANVDSAFGMSFYKSAYEASPVVFGSFPSLHGAWPFLLAVFPSRLGRWTIFYTAFVWFSACYLRHHYLIDLLGGAFVAYWANWIGRLVFDGHDDVPCLPTAAASASSASSTAATTAVSAAAAGVPLSSSALAAAAAAAAHARMLSGASSHAPTLSSISSSSSLLSLQKGASVAGVPSEFS